MLARIVVIEDDVYMREELIDMLKKAGYDAVPLPAFENAVSQLAELSPDLILLDINLPFRSGFEICKEIKAKHLGAVLILTARDKLQDELHALGLGADDYLTKPCNMERLLARTKNLLRRREEQVQQGLLDGAPPFKRAEFDIMFGEGISKIGEIIDLGVDYGVIKKAGSWFSYGDKKIGQGRDAVKELLQNDEELRNEIEANVREAMKTKKE